MRINKVIVKCDQCPRTVEMTDHPQALDGEWVHLELRGTRVMTDEELAKATELGDLSDGLVLVNDTADLCSPTCALSWLADNLNVRVVGATTFGDGFQLKAVDKSVNEAELAEAVARAGATSKAAAEVADSVREAADAHEAPYPSSPDAVTGARKPRGKA